MRRPVRIALKVLLWIVAVFVVLFAVDVAVLAYPNPWFERSARAGNITVFSGDDFAPDLQSIARGVHHRVSAAEVYNEDADLRVFIVSDRAAYNRFARLALVPTHVPGFNLSVLNNSFVCVPLLKRRHAGVNGHLANSAVGGGLEHSIAHELIHDFAEDRVGFFRTQQLPPWKSEGYAEYAAAHAAMTEERDGTLAERIENLEPSVRGDRAREYYHWSLVVEYLATKRGYSFAEIMADSVTFADANAEMMAWYTTER